MDTAILPLAVTMMAGPQILSAIIFATSKKPVAASLAFTAGVAAATTLGVIIATLLAGAFGSHVGDGTGEPSTLARGVEFGLVALLILLTFRTFRNRERIQPPKWLGKLQETAPSRAFFVAAVLILCFPSDVIILMTTGVHLASRNLDVTAALPFIGLTTLIAALPLLTLLLLGKRAERAVPAFREWMNGNIWIVNIAVYAVFIFLILD